MFWFSLITISLLVIDSEISIVSFSIYLIFPLNYDNIMSNDYFLLTDHFSHTFCLRVHVLPMMLRFFFQFHFEELHNTDYIFTEWLSSRFLYTTDDLCVSSLLWSSLLTYDHQCTGNISGASPLLLSVHLAIRWLCL